MDKKEICGLLEYAIFYAEKTIKHLTPHGILNDEHQQVINDIKHYIHRCQQIINDNSTNDE